MNYYAQGGQAHGLKSIAQEMQQMGRGGDTMLAHINPQEAALLKRLGGSGTINPATGLPEFLKIGPVSIGGKGIVGVGKLSAGKILSKFDDVVLQPITGAIQDVVQDVAKATGPVGQAAAAYFGGPLGAAAYAGLAGEDGFNFKRGLLAGAMTYGAQNLAEGLGSAGDAGAPPVPDPTVVTPPLELGLAGTDAVAGEVARTGLTEPGLGALDRFAAGAGNMYDKAVTGVGNAFSSATDPNYYADKFASIPDKLTNMGSGISNLTSSDPAIRAAAMDAFKASGATMTNTALPMYMGYTGSLALDEMDKLKKEQDIENAKIAAEQAEFDARINKGRESAIAAMQANPYMYAAGGDVSGPDVNNPRSVASLFNNVLDNFRPPVEDSSPEVVGPRGVASLFRPFNGFRRPSVEVPSQDVSLFENLLDKVQPSVGFPRIGGFFRRSFGNQPTPQTDIMEAQRFGFNPERIKNPADISLYAKMINQGKNDNEKLAYSALVNNPFQFAAGGDVPGFGIRALVNKPEQYGGETETYAAGGQPRYLSGGGDGMSDSIPATINGNQPARLADGEFVIPADVVSHLGNGSSKAGAKQLYSMMDKVRSARTGTKKQGRQINPNKFLPA